MNNPKISICIPVFNGEDYLTQCIESVISQTYQNIEVIIIDDHSTDNSVQIVKSFIKDFPAIILYKNASNSGLVENWNKCLGLATGEWIKFLFQDDFLEKNCIEVFAEKIAADSTGCPLLVSERRFKIEREATHKKERYFSKHLPTLTRINIEMHDGYITPESISNAAVEHMAMNIIGEPTVIMFRKDVIEMTGTFNRDLDQICDLEFVLRIASIYGLMYIPEKLTFFRIHDKSTTSTNLSEKYYRLSNLEPVKLAHLYLFSEKYKSLRSSLTFLNRIKLKVYFYLRGHEAWKNAKKADENMHDFDESVKAFPMMSHLKKRIFIYRFIFPVLFAKRFLLKLIGR